MSGRDLLIHDVPKELVEWLQAEARRCGQTVDELVISILESYRFWNCRNDNQNEAQSRPEEHHREREAERLPTSEQISEAIKRAFGG